MDRILVSREKLVYSIPEAAEVLGISTTKMYEVVRMEGFPVLELGRRKVVPIKPLEKWLEKMAGVG